MSNPFHMLFDQKSETKESSLGSWIERERERVSVGKIRWIRKNGSMLKSVC